MKRGSEIHRDAAGVWPVGPAHTASALSQLLQDAAKDFPGSSWQSSIKITKQQPLRLKVTWEC